MRSAICTSALGLALMTGLYGCAADAAVEGGKGGGAPLQATEIDLPDTIETSGPLTAYQTPEELAAGSKYDALISTRTQSELFAPTAPPTTQVRAVAEWEHVDSIIVHWENQLDNFYVQMVDALHRAANVHLVTKDIQDSTAAKQRLSALGMDTNRIKFFEYQNDSIWTRDYGPITVEKPNGDPAFIDLDYYPNRTRDNAIPTLMADYYSLDVYRPDIQAEGGNFMSNGAGVCAFSDVVPARNGLSVQEVVDSYKAYFGCTTVVVGEHLQGEGTGHIDMWTKFGQEGVVLVGQYDVNDDPVNAAILDRNAAKFAAVTLADGSNLKVVRIPMPAPRGSGQNKVFESFTNSLVVNQTVVIPRYTDAQRLEAGALAAYKTAFPEGYQFKWVDSSDIIDWGGAVHCTTMSYSVGPIPDLGTIPAPVTAQSLFQLNPVLPIEDAQETRSDIDVPRSLTQTTGVIAIDIALEHTYTGDLVISLEHNGVSDVIFEGKGAGRNIRDRFTSTAFEGTPRAGTWTLVVADTARQDDGTLYAWTLGFAK